MSERDVEYTLTVIPRAQLGKKRKSIKQYGGTRILFIASNNAILLYSFTLTKGCYNNMVEDEVVITGLELAL